MYAPQAGGAPPCSPYRVNLPIPGAPPRSSLASQMLAACALVATLTSLHLSYTVARLVPPRASPRLLACAPSPRAVVAAVPLRPVDPVASAAVAEVEPAAPAPRDEALGVRALGRGVYVISRRAIDRALAGPETLARRTRILPEVRDGRTVGVRVFGIRQGDVLSSLGFANGDVILRVNELEIASPDRCLEAYARLRATDRLTVTYERGGRVRSHVYAIITEV